MTKETNGTDTWEEIVIDKVIGMDIEPEDTDVGIFGATFFLVMKEENGGQVQLILGEDQMAQLAAAIKPYLDDIEAQQQMDAMLNEEHKDDKLDTSIAGDIDKLKDAVLKRVGRKK